MPLTKLEFRPGINREITDYSNEGGWYDGDKIRFRLGFPEKIGGWERFSGTSFLGTCRALHGWTSLSNERLLSVSTHLKNYVVEGNGFYDITPIRATTAAGDATFSASANTLSADVAIDDETISLTNSSGFPTTGVIKINSEIISYAGISGNDLTGCLRGQYSTTAATHSNLDTVTCATLVVSETAHGAVLGDFVTFSGATTLGDQITADVLNQEYQITHIVNDNSFYVMAREVSTIPDITVSGSLDETPVFATSSDSGNGGASVVAEYQINTGLEVSLSGLGWGAGLYGRGTWNSAATVLAVSATLRTVSHDNFGEDLLLNVRNGGIYYWDKTGGLTARAVELSSLSGSNLAPTIAKQILVSDRDRHVIAFGCDPQNNIGVQDPMLIRFSDQESLREWESTATTTAGDLRLGAGSEIVTAVETRLQTLVFTDVALYSMQYLGPPFTFGVELVSQNVSIAGPLAAIAVDDTVFWMGEQEFYTFAGTVQRISCTVRDYVFNDINIGQLQKVTAGLNTKNTELWWFYPSAGSDENDRYVIYNYQEGVWYYGTLARTCWLDRGTTENPIAASTDGYLYYHEFGFDDGSTGGPITSYITSSPVDLEDGQQFTFVRRLIPDFDFRNTAASTVPSIDVTTRVRNSSNSSFLKETTSSVSNDTELVHLRLRGRQMSVVVQSTQEGVAWRLGSLRYDLQPDGRR